MKLIFNIFMGLLFVNAVGQKKVTDSCYIDNHKFVLYDFNGVAEIKAFLNEEEVPVLKTIKMSPPIFFVRKNNTSNILSDDIFMKNGDIVKVFLLTGNEAPEYVKENRNIKYKEDFCGMNVQGIIISPDGITTTELMLNGLTCIKEHPLSIKDLYTFTNSEIRKEE